MRLPGFFGARSRLLALWSLALGLLPGQAFAQPSKDNTSPPIDVPTTPVPQGPAAAPPPASPPPAKPAPKPAPAAPAPKADAPKADSSKGSDEEQKDLKYNNEGVFKISGSKGPGVVGGTGKKAPAASAAAPAAKGKAKGGGATSAANVAQWPGFRMTEDGGSEVMVEFSKATTPPTEHKAAGSITYVFKGVHVAKTNNKNPLITVHFNTPVASARLVSKKGELHLVIEYRAGADAAATTGMRPGSDGAGQQFFVKFPAGSWLPKGADGEEIGPAPTQKLKAKGKADKSSEEKPAAPAPAPKTESGSKTGPTP